MYLKSIHIFLAFLKEKLKINVAKHKTPKPKNTYIKEGIIP